MKTLVPCGFPLLTQKFDLPCDNPQHMSEFSKLHIAGALCPVAFRHLMVGTPSILQHCFFAVSPDGCSAGGNRLAATKDIFIKASIQPCEFPTS